MDRERYLENQSKCLDLIFVSGDIIQGAPGDDISSLTSVAEQYEEAKRFFIDLANELFSGDRGRIVIVPGNHDISWYHSKSSMEKIAIDLSDKDKIKALAKQVLTSQSIRFNWNDLSFYRIVNKNVYNERFKLFCEFYEDFYEGKRKYSTDPDLQFDIFCYNDLKLSIIAFNSCFCNDHLCKEGKINPVCISRSCLELQRRTGNENTKVAVWHHNTSGSPSQNDYIDPVVLENISEMNVELAFHGHQHHNEVISRFSKIFSDRQLYLVSAPSLCAGPSQLPVGYNRGYNVIEIDIPEGKIKIRSREMKQSSFESPVWGESIVEGCNKSWVEFPINKNVANNSTSMHKVSEIESMIGNREYSNAMQALKDVSDDNGYKRRLLFMAMSELDMSEEIVHKFFPPQTVQESLLLLEIFWENRDYEKLKEILSLEPLISIQDPGIKVRVDDYKRRVEIYSGVKK